MKPTADQRADRRCLPPAFEERVREIEVRSDSVEHCASYLKSWRELAPWILARPPWAVEV
jgi:hypothetical protein